MKRADHIQTELNELGAKMLMNMPSTMPYTLPVNYFGTLSDEMTDVVRINEITDLQPEWSNKMPFKSPDASYFEELSTQILVKVSKEEEWSKSNPFTVPQGYFDTFPQTIIAAIKTEAPKAKRRVPLFRTMRLAASIAFILFAGFAVMKLNNTKTNQSVIAMAPSDAEIRNYVSENLDDFDTDLIINTLASNNTNVSGTIDISDAEIKAYLDETGWN